MNLNDFDERFDLKAVQIGIVDNNYSFLRDATPEIKSYIISKLKEFWEKAENSIEEGFNGEELLGGEWYEIKENLRKELKELQDK